jgi:spore germination protein YaaH
VPPPGPRLGSPEIFGYMPNWSIDTNIDYGAITTIAYFGLGAGADGHLKRTNPGGSLTTEYSRWQSSKVSGIISATHAAGDKFVLTVERMAWDAGGQAATTALLSSAEARRTLVSDIVGEVTSRGVDGVSLDFEPILTTQRDNFADFVRQLRTALDAANPAYQLTFAATSSQRVATLHLMADLTSGGWADAVIIMGYPLRAGDAKKAGSISPLTSDTAIDLTQTVDLYLNYVAPDKILLALAWYGRTWPTVGPELHSATQTDRTLYGDPDPIGYDNSLPYADVYGRNYDSAEQSAWLSYSSRWCAEAPQAWRQIYYDDVESLGAKYDFVTSRGLRGIGIWALGYEGQESDMWSLLRVKFRGLVDTTPPSGSFELDVGDHLCQAPRAKLDFQLSDGAGGSGPVFIRLSNASGQSGGLLSAARTYPATDQIAWQMDDSLTGGSLAIGARTVYAQWRDVAGNWSPVASTTFNFTLPGAGTLSVAGGATLVATAVVRVEFDQTGGRPITAVRLSNSPTLNNGVLANTVSIPLGSAVDFSLINPSTGGVDADGLHTVYAQTQDTAGCWSAVTSAAVTLDRAAPAGTLSIVGSPTYSLTRDVHVLAPATDALSGVTTIALSNDGASWTTYPYSADPIAWSAGATRPDGPWTIYARWQDASGNWSGIATASTILDTQAPTGAITLNNGARATNAGAVRVTPTATDATSGVAGMLLANDPTTTNGVLTNGVPEPVGPVDAWPLPGAGTGPGVSEGSHTVYAQWQDGAGNWSAVASASILVDRTPPTVSIPLIGLPQGAQLNAGALPVSVNWSSTDTGSGVASTHLEKSSDGVAWFDAVPAVVDPASTWRIRVTATDFAGNSCVPAVSTPFAAQVTQESTASVKYTGTWRKAKSTASSGGATRYATARGATATLTFTGRAVAWVAPLGATFGKAKVFVDGVVVATIDLRSATQSRMLVFARTWTTSGKHTIKIKVLGTSGRARVDLDAFVVLN